MFVSQKFGEDLSGGLIAEDAARAFIEEVGDDVEFVLRGAGQIGAFGQIPHATPDRQHGLKYRLWAGRGGVTLVRYDNERGKGDHRHTAAGEHSYVWRGMVALVEDFLSDVEAMK